MRGLRRRHTQRRRGGLRLQGIVSAMCKFVSCQSSPGFSIVLRFEIAVNVACEHGLLEGSPAIATKLRVVHPASDEELHFVPASSGAAGIAVSECLAISGGAHMTHDDDSSHFREIPFHVPSTGLSEANIGRRSRVDGDPGHGGAAIIGSEKRWPYQGCPAR
jgi:hypothetical protein